MIGGFHRGRVHGSELKYRAVDHMTLYSYCSRCGVSVSTEEGIRSREAVDIEGVEVVATIGIEEQTKTDSGII
jgi:hypothetical protein